MKWIDFLSHDDFGKEVFLNVLQYKQFCLFQIMIDLPEYSGSSGIIMSIGHSSVFGISFNIPHFGISFDFFTWRARQLDYWRNGIDYFLKDNDLYEVSTKETNLESSDCSRDGV